MTNPHQEPQVIGFNSLDEMFDFMQKQEQAANSMTTDEQRAISWGDYWYRMVQMAEGPLEIYGYIMTLAEIKQAEFDAGSEDWEWEHIHNATLDSHERGYRFGPCYSQIEPDGELGNTHISSMTKITEETFEEAKANDWRLG